MVLNVLSVNITDFKQIILEDDYILMKITTENKAYFSELVKFIAPERESILNERIEYGLYILACQDLDVDGFNKSLNENFKMRKRFYQI